MDGCCLHPHGAEPLNESGAVARAQISPTTLFFIEGGGQLPYSMCWGDGFVTDPNIISANGLSDPNSFFQTLLTKDYLNNVVIAPHYYPPSISQAKTGCAAL